MFAVYAAEPRPVDPLSALRLGDRPQAPAPPGWTAVTVRAATLNMHDISTLRGIGMRPEQYPMVLGCDGAGVLGDGTEVVVHGLVNEPGWVGPETLDPGRTVLSERYPGSFAEQVLVPARNVVTKPPSLTFAEAACLPTAWLTAYRALFVRAGLRPGQTVLVQGRERVGSIATAMMQLAAAAGARVWALAPQGQEDSVRRLGAHEVFTDDTALPREVDVVVDGGVDEASWSRSLTLLRPGGVVVCAGYRSGATDVRAVQHALHQLVFRELQLVGCAMGTTQDLGDLLAFLDRTGLRPLIDRELPLTRAPEGFAAMLGGEVTGKIVFTA
ncbi:zinc-binding dehydrogenase [Winogradskya consettensis]|uniref:Zn-dependent oxidoreductase n=1 Tax=Winogradskya consettensis TaxID=113560 RepID=A0A919SAZ4_9ACTN|nr:zinc-binding dehydrogenase [Actinoplanes consettensis]GIM68455.1 Zn-dependent oxidoreductase [Actinoplanes consettensis]